MASKKQSADAVEVIVYSGCVQERKLILSLSSSGAVAMDVEVTLYVHGFKITAKLTALYDRSIAFEVTRTNGLPCENGFDRLCQSYPTRRVVEEAILTRYNTLRADRRLFIS